jgi:hypothetical protein
MLTEHLVHVPNSLQPTDISFRIGKQGCPSLPLFSSMIFHETSVLTHISTQWYPQNSHSSHSSFSMFHGTEVLPPWLTLGGESSLSSPLHIYHLIHRISLLNPSLWSMVEWFISASVRPWVQIPVPQTPIQTKEDQTINIICKRCKYSTGSLPQLPSLGPKIHFGCDQSLELCLVPATFWGGTGSTGLSATQGDYLG